MIIGGIETAETSCEYAIPMAVNMLNEDLALMPQSYQNLFCALAEQHLDRFECSMPYILPLGLQWVLASLHFRIVGPLDNILLLRGKTWYSQKKGPYFRREFSFADETGKLRFQGCAFNILMNMEKRTVFREKETPFHIDPPTADFLVEDVRPHFKGDIPFETVGQRRTMNSDIDALGHVNNCRYGAFAYDLFTEEEKPLLKSLKLLDIYFLAEIRAGETLAMQKAVTEEGIFIRGLKEDQNPSFVIRFA